MGVSEMRKTRMQGSRIMLLSLALYALVSLLFPAPARAADTTYLLEVTNGAATGDESKIEFFLLNYRDPSDEERVQLLYPFGDSLSDSYERAAALSDAQDTRDAYIRSTYGYEAAALISRAAFQSYQTDQYLFTLPFEMRYVINLQMFTSGAGAWSCQDIRLFRVDELGGLYRDNDGSAEGYIDFRGTLVAECGKGKNFAWATDTLTTIPMATGFDAAYAAHELQHGESTLAARFDFADTMGAGLETLATPVGERTANLLETAALTIRYLDRYGSTRETTVPFLINATESTAAWGAEMDARQIGLAQQGESAALGVFLPDYASIRSAGELTLTLGASEAQKVLQCSIYTSPSLLAASDADTANIVTTAVYELSSTEVSASVDSGSGALRYVFRGDPVVYHMATSVSGELVKIGANRIQLRDYTHGSNLTPPDKTERYLIEIETDDVDKAGTAGDILLSVSYTDLEGNKKSTDELNARLYAQDFYGYWPGSADIFGYYANVARGQTLRFFIPVQNVKTITDVKVRLSGGDEWQMKDLTLSTVSAYDRRSVSWESVSVDGMTSDRRFDRYVQSEQIFRLSEHTANQILFWPDEAAESVGPAAVGGDVDVTARSSVDWSQIRYSMNYQQASQELGFTKTRCLYHVTVKVKGDQVTDSLYGDCGSKNLFYFRLLFKNGSSAFVLANQQLQSDGFRTGKPEEFDISTNQDYGDVVAVQIIPDDLSGSSDMYDKLNIDYIEVKRHSDSALTPTWTVHDVGWIGIDYHDDAEAQSVTGRKGRTEGELAQVYMVDSSSYSANLLVTITTDKYADNEPQFMGTLAATVHYDTVSLPDQEEPIADVVKLMNDYAHHSGGDTLDTLTVSDPKLLFREGHTDRFIISLKDVKTVRSIELLPRSTAGTTWNIANVTVGLINGDGRLTINTNGEYEQIYEEGKRLTYQARCTSTGTPKYKKYLPAVSAGELAQSINIYFEEQTIELSPESKQWSSTLSRTPETENDTLNIFIFPLTNPAVSGYDLSAVAQYTDSFAQSRQAATGTMRKTIYNGRTVFYTVGLNAGGLTALNALYFKVDDRASTTMLGIERAVVQQVRNGVVVNSWDLACAETIADMGAPLGNRVSPTRERQRVRLQLGADTDSAVLEAEKTDLAVALWYRGDDPSEQELRTPYVYLSDQGYQEIHPGQLLELTFDQLNIAEITGISIAASGTINVTVDAAWADDRQVNRENEAIAVTKGEYSFARSFTAANVPYRMNPSGSVKLMELTFRTDAATASISGGTNGPVRMTLGYYDDYGDLRTNTYEDIRPYIEGADKRFLADGEATVKLLACNISELRWVELEPYRDARDTSTAPSMWSLKELRAALDEDGSVTNRSVGALIVEGEPLRVSMADILLTADIAVGNSDEHLKLTGGSADIQLRSGDSLTIAAKAVGSAEGVTVKLESLDSATGATGQASLDDTRGYTEAELARLASSAASPEGAAFWRETVPETGSFNASDKGDVYFSPPRNYTDGSLSYRITIRSREANAASVVVNVTVANETDPIPKELEYLAQTQQAEPAQSSRIPLLHGASETESEP